MELPPILEATPYIVSGSQYAETLLYHDPRLKAVFPADNELQIDIDNEVQYETFDGMICLFEEMLGSRTIAFKCHPSKSGLPRRHITVTLPFTVDAQTRILLQAILGSDPRRELLSYCGLVNGDPTPTVFAELKEAPRPCTETPVLSVTQGS